MVKFGGRGKERSEGPSSLSGFWRISRQLYDGSAILGDADYRRKSSLGQGQGVGGN